MIVLSLIANPSTVLAGAVPEINIVTENNGQMIVREDNIFAPESTLKVSIITPITYNRYRLVAMDYVMVITDPIGNIVFIDKIEDRSRSYTTESKAIFSKKIPDTWLNGEYTIDIYSYDRVDYNELSRVKFDIYDTDSAIDDLTEFFDEEPSDSVLEDLEVLKSRSHANIVKDRLYFIVDKDSNPCKIQNLSISQSVIPINSTIQIIAEVENTVADQKNVTYELFLNDEQIKTFNSILGPREWKTFIYEINDPPVGENQIRMGNREANFVVSDTPLGPTRFIYLDIFTDRPTLYATERFNVSITILNTGRKGSQPVFISVNNNKTSRDVELDYGEKKTVDFQVVLDEPGTYSARIIGTEISKLLFIQEPPDKEEDKDEKSGFLLSFSGPGAIYITLFTIIFIGILIYHRQRNPVKISEEPAETELYENINSIEESIKYIHEHI